MKTLNKALTALFSGTAIIMVLATISLAILMLIPAYILRTLVKAIHKVFY